MLYLTQSEMSSLMFEITCQYTPKDHNEFGTRSCMQILEYVKFMQMMREKHEKTRVSSCLFEIEISRIAHPLCTNGAIVKVTYICAYL